MHHLFEAFLQQPRKALKCNFFCKMSVPEFTHIERIIHIHIKKKYLIHHNQLFKLHARPTKVEKILKRVFSAFHIVGADMK